MADPSTDRPDSPTTDAVRPPWASVGVMCLVVALGLVAVAALGGLALRVFRWAAGV